MIETLQSSKRRIFLKAVACIVVFTFIATQFDIKLAFAYEPAANPLEFATPLSPSELREKLEAVRFQEDKEHLKAEEIAPTSNTPGKPPPPPQPKEQPVPDQSLFGFPD